MEKDLGHPHGGYPPWAYVTGALFTWPARFEAARLYYATINILLILGILAVLARERLVQVGGRISETMQRWQP